MSTDYRPLRNIRAAQLFDGRLKAYDVFEHFKPDMTITTRRCLTDGTNYLWAHIGEDGFLSSFTRYAFNDARLILSAVAEVFDLDIVSEHEPQYWGFDNEQEWHTEQAKSAREYEKAKRKFEKDLLKYVRGERNNIKPGTDEEIKAEIAKKLAEKDPTLLLPVNRMQFLCEIKSIYDREVLRLPF